MIFIVHTYNMQISLHNSSGKVVYLRGSMEPPLGTNGSKSIPGHWANNVLLPKDQLTRVTLRTSENVVST